MTGIGLCASRNVIKSALVSGDFRAMAAALPPIPPVSRLTPLIIRITGGNPGKFTLQGTNTYLIGRGSERLLIDTGQGFPIWAETIRTILDEEKAGIKTIVLTHHHHDHTSGLKDIPRDGGELEVWRHPASPSSSEYRDMLEAAISAFGGEIRQLEDGKTFPVPGSDATLKTIHTPGHTPDHCALLLQPGLADADVSPVLFTGDAVLGHGTAVFEDPNTYIASLHKMRSVISKLTAGSKAMQAFPAHGEVVQDADAKLKEYIEHRAQREREVLAILEEHESTRGLLPMDIVKVIYKDYPESLHIPAEGGTKLVLKKLENEGKVVQNDGKWSVSAQVKNGQNDTVKAGL